MLTAVRDGRLTLERLVELMATNPRRIYNLPEPPETHVEITMERYTIANEGLQTKCGWTPFAGMAAAGRVQRVVLRGNVVYEAGQVLAAPGSGQINRRNEDPT
jgi:carbamoyl-phosphate synthase/aspartate carbamoyltransferase/dihydroorotase